MTRILGAVLAGGRSSRFGSDKARAVLGHATLAEHAAAAVAHHVETVVTIGGADGLKDLPAPGLGPLGGIAGALDHAGRHGFGAVLTIACDMPVVPNRVIEALLRRVPSYCVDAPVLGFWPVSALGTLLTLLQSADDERSASIRRFAQSIGAVPIQAGGPLANVNTPEDLSVL